MELGNSNFQVQLERTLSEVAILLPEWRLGVMVGAPAGVKGPGWAAVQKKAKLNSNKSLCVVQSNTTMMEQAFG